MPNLKVLVTIGAISSLGVLAGSIIAPIEARYIQSFTDDPVLIGSVFGVGSVFLAILSYWVGRLSDSLGRRRIILTGLFFGIIYAILYSLVFNIFHLYGVKFTWAISAVAMGPVLAAYLQDFLEPYASKGKYFGYVYSAESICGSVGALIGGYVATTYGLAAPFSVVAILYLGLFGFAFFALPSESVMFLKNEPKEILPKRKIGDTVQYIFSKPALLFYLCVNTSVGINWGIKAFLWPFLIFELVQSDVITGSIFATMGLVAFVLLPVSGRMVDLFGPYRIVLFQLVVLGSTGVGLALSGDIVLFWILAAVYTIGEVLNGPAQAVLLTENVDPQLRGEVMGLDATLDQLLAVLAPLLAGYSMTAIGLTATFLWFMLLYWVSFVIAGGVYLRYIRTAT